MSSAFEYIDSTNILSLINAYMPILKYLLPPLQSFYRDTGLLKRTQNVITNRLIDQSFRRYKVASRDACLHNLSYYPELRTQTAGPSGRTV